MEDEFYALSPQISKQPVTTHVLHISEVEIYFVEKINMFSRHVMAHTFNLSTHEAEAGK